MAMAKTIRCKWEGAEVTLGMDEAGSGRSIVLLPALSSISTRAEMRPLFDRLAPEFRIGTVDWPGFGDLSRPWADWSPEILSAFLNWFLSDVVTPPHIVIAAGHAATYALYQAVHQPGTIERLILIAPTWRGPLPTMMGGQRLVRPRTRCLRPSRRWPASLPPQCQPTHYREDGARARLRRSRLADRRTSEREAHRDGRRSPKFARPASMPCESAFRPQGSQKARRAKARDATTKTKHDWNRLDATTHSFATASTPQNGGDALESRIG